MVGELGTGRLDVMLADLARAHQARGYPEGEPMRDGQADGDTPDDPGDVDAYSRFWQRDQGRQQTDRHIEAIV